MTGTEIFNIAMTLIDEAPVNDTFDVSNTAEYKAKAPYILNTIQTELLSMSDYFKTHTVSRKMITPTNGSFETKVHDTIDVNIEAELSKAYYFEVCGNGTAYIEDYTDTWNTISTIAFNTTTNTPYSGLITPTTGATRTRIRFSGSYYYTFTNTALFKETFDSSSKIPSYRPYVKITMPTDFDTLNEVIMEDGNYILGIDYKFEGKDMYLSYTFEGNMRIIYRPILTMITTLTQTLELDASICRSLMPYGLGAKLMINENTKVASYLQSVYDELKQTMKKKRPAERTKIIDYYGANCEF